MSYSEINKPIRECLWKQCLICVLLMISIMLIYKYSYVYVYEIGEERRAHIEYFAKDEFLKTVNLARTIDKYGVEKGYLLEFEAKATASGNVKVYLQSGAGSKYLFDEKVTVGTEYRKYSLEVYPQQSLDKENTSYLAFYSGDKNVLVSVKKIHFTPIE